MSCVKSVNKANQEKKFFKAKKSKNLKREEFVELGDRELICDTFTTRVLKLVKRTPL